MALPANTRPASKGPPFYLPDRIQRRLQSRRFLDDTIMDGPAGCTVTEFGRPRLRKCPFDIASISWKDAKSLGRGLDGWVWRVHFGDQGPFALKLFWKAEQPQESGEYFAVQRECQNVAYLQMIQAAVEQANKEGGSKPALLFPDPKINEDALENLYRFADENRLNPPAPEIQELEGLVPITSIPPITKCYGWLKFNMAEVLPRIPPRLRPHPITIEKITRSFQEDKEYIAIVYEYIEDGPNDPAKVKQFLEFMHMAGFCAATSPHGLNWKNSMLVDFSDINPLLAFQWGGNYKEEAPLVAADSEAAKQAQEAAQSLGNDIVAKNWNKKETLSQNYRRLGLVARLRAPTGGTEPPHHPQTEPGSSEAASRLKASSISAFKIKPAGQAVLREARVERDAAGKIIRVITDEKPNPLNDPLNALDSDSDSDEDVADGRQAEEGEEWGGIDEDEDDDPRVVRELERQAAQPVEARLRHQSQGEVEWLQRLVDKHGEDTAAMARDIKINRMQQTEADIARRIRRWKGRAGGGS